MKADRLAKKNELYRRFVERTNFLQKLAEGHRILQGISVKERWSIRTKRKERGPGTQRNSAEVYSICLKLSEVELLKFGGNLMKWKVFRDYLNLIIHMNGNIKKIDKFQYLVSLVEERARMAVEFLPRNDEMYERAISILMKRFGSKKLSR